MSSAAECLLWLHYKELQLGVARVTWCVATPISEREAQISRCRCSHGVSSRCHSCHLIICEPTMVGAVPNICGHPGLLHGINVWDSLFKQFSLHSKCLVQRNLDVRTCCIMIVAYVSSQDGLPFPSLKWWPLHYSLPAGDAPSVLQHYTDMITVHQSTHSPHYLL